MRPYIVHISFFCALLAVSTLGFALDVRPVAAFLGAFAAFWTDPLLVLLAIAIGGLARNVMILAGATLVAGIAFSLYIASANAALGAELTVLVTFTRTCALLSMALVANVVRLLAMAKIRRAG